MPDQFETQTPSAGDPAEPQDRSPAPVTAGSGSDAPNATPAGDAASRKKMSRAEAGRKGGMTTKKRYGDDHFGKIGRIGGKKGGETTKQRYGTEFYQKIGRIGGSK